MLLLKARKLVRHKDRNINPYKTVNLGTEDNTRYVIPAYAKMNY